MPGEEEKCPLCRQRAEIAAEGDVVVVQGCRCGSFHLSLALLPVLSTLDSSSLIALSAAALQASDSGGVLILNLLNIDAETRPLARRVRLIESDGLQDSAFLWRASSLPRLFLPHVLLLLPRHAVLLFGRVRRAMLDGVIRQSLPLSERPSQR